MSHPQGGAWLKTATSRLDTLSRVSIEASGIYFELALWSSKNDTRGVIPWDDLHVAVARKVTANRARSIVTGDLARVELVKTTDAGIDLGDFWRDENPPGETWHDPVKRMRWARGKRLLRDSELCKRIKERDRFLCRYCGIRVNWNNKTGADGGTYDHVDPDIEENIESNVVVSCRRCNGRKRDRTPDQAGMLLLPPGTTAATVAAQEARAGPTPGQPPVNPRLTRPGSSRARPDRANPRLTPGQPPQPAAGLDLPRPPVGFTVPVPSHSVHSYNEAPPHTDDDAPAEQEHNR